MKHLFAYIITLLLGVLTVHAGNNYLTMNHTIMISANDNDTVGFSYLPEKNESRYGFSVLHETIIPRFDGYMYIPGIKNIPYYAVFKKEGDVFSSTIYEATTGHIQEIIRYVKIQNSIVLQGMQEHYKNGKLFYQEQYQADELLFSEYMDDSGIRLRKYSFELLKNWSEFRREGDIAKQLNGKFIKLVLKEEFYPTQTLKSKTTYQSDDEGKAVLKTTYFDVNGKKQAYKPTNAVKVVQEYINTNFEYAPIKSEGGAITTMDLLIPVQICVDSTGVIQSITQTDKLSYSYNMITGYTTYETDKRTGYTQREGKTTYYSNNNEIKMYIMEYGSQIIDSMTVFMKHLDANLVCTPEYIGKTPQASTINTAIKRNCLKHYHKKKGK